MARNFMIGIWIAGIPETFPTIAIITCVAHEGHLHNFPVWRHFPVYAIGRTMWNDWKLRIAMGPDLFVIFPNIARLALNTITRVSASRFAVFPTLICATGRN